MNSRTNKILIIAILISLLVAGCSLVFVIGKNNKVKTDVKDDIKTDANFDSINILTTQRKRETNKSEPKKGE